MIAPGIHTIDAADYHADPCPQPSLSNSVAQILLSQSPRHAFLAHPKLNPLYESENKREFDLGTAAHSMLLENDESKIVLLDYPDYRKKEAQESRDDAYARGKTPILPHQADDLDAMVTAARKYVASSELAGIFEESTPEQTVIWQEGDIWCRARLDLLRKDRSIILDYKTTTDANPEVFARQIVRMMYHVQAAFYTRGVRAVEECDPKFVFLAQEVKPPYACSLLSLSNAYIEMAQSYVQEAITLWTECLKTGKWPAYPNRICYVEPPNWLLTQWMEQQEMQA